jgi:hypothetical protein
LDWFQLLWTSVFVLVHGVASFVLCLLDALFDCLGYVADLLLDVGARLIKLSFALKLLVLG